MQKSEQILETLTTELTQGQYPVGAKFPSEYELANRFRVARLTVNKAVDQLVAAGWLERGVRGSGTRVRNHRKFPKGRILYIGNLMHNLTTSMALTGLSSQAFQRGYYVTAASPSDTALGDFLATAVASEDFTGIVTSNYLWFDNLCSGLPVVYLDYFISGSHSALYHITSNNAEACRQMVKAVTTRGYRNPVIYTDCHYRITERLQRVRGAMQALRELGLDDAEKRLYVGAAENYIKADAVAQLQRILHDYPKADAIITTSDELALRMREALQDAGISSPERILVTGFGNIPSISNIYHIPTVEQHFFHIGVAAADMLLDLVEGKSSTEPKTQVVMTELVNLEYIPSR